MHHIGKPNWRFGIRPLQRLGNDRPRGAEHGSSFRPITSRDVAKLPLLTIGAQFQGSNNNTIGQQATVDVFLSISEIVKDAVAKREDRRLTLRNASDRKVIIVLASDPDVRIQEEFGNTLCNNVVIEIKGGSDRSTLSGKRMTTMAHTAVRLLVSLLAAALLWPQPFALAQAAPGGSPARSSVLSTGGGQALIDPSDTVLLLLDHQAGLFQTVKDISVAELRANTIALAKLATLLNIPVITSASEPNGPNGPLMPEIHQFAPHAVFVPRKGEVNAWDNDDFVKAVRATGKQTLIIAGVWTSVCVMFPALDAKAAGFKVYAVMDASGDPSEMVSRTTLARFAQAGIVPTTANAVICELHRTWNRPEAADIATLYTIVAPNYAAVMESYRKAQDVAGQPKK